MIGVFEKLIEMVDGVVYCRKMQGEEKKYVSYEGEVFAIFCQCAGLEEKQNRLVEGLGIIDRQGLFFEIIEVELEQLVVLQSLKKIATHHRFFSMCEIEVCELLEVMLKCFGFVLIFLEISGPMVALFCVLPHISEIDRVFVGDALVLSLSDRSVNIEVGGMFCEAVYEVWDAREGDGCLGF